MRRPPLAAVLGLVVCSACSSSAPRPVSELRPLVAPAAPTPTPATVEPPPAALVEPSEPAPLPEAEPPAPLATQLLIEPPYSALGHARLATEMASLERDDELFRWALGGSSDPAHPSNQPGYHPATRVVVDVSLLSRAPKGSTKRLERIARSSGYWPLRGCFEDAQRLSAKTERAARVRLTLSANGKVLGSRLLGTAPERDYARCVQARLQRLDFSPGFTRKLDVEISVKQWPGHAPVPPRAPDPTPKLPRELGVALQSLTPALGACYERGLRVDPRLWGRVALQVELDVDGAVKSAAPIETRFPDAEVAECARQALLGAHLVKTTVDRFSVAIRFGQCAPATLSPAGA
ncbi:MAG TPA: hypothetical protein VEQ58_02165, partial [Polyangiaceae bacterium]|nr:hypothetical protein [Polyangiaceae bacterium]